VDAGEKYLHPMFQIPELSDVQRRNLYIIFGGFLALGALFFSLAQGNASPTPKPTISVSRIAPIAPSTPSPSTIVVDVAGKVLHPQIYTLPMGSRAADAIAAAGGAIKGVALTDINLAHLLVDGEQIVVGAPPVVTSTSKVGAKRGKSTTAIVNINTATSAQLEVLAGVGPVMAAKIIAYRNTHGKFTSIDGIAKVPGFGKSKFALVKSQLRI
jgi:competence protein ComEA